jgi:predicted nuclease of predicted toxin-antitoxin system
MRFKVDENLHREIATAIAARGHDASTVHDQGLTGARDPVLAEHCRQEGRVLVTLDLDFADIRTYPPRNSPGIVVFRLRDQSRPSALRVLSFVLDQLDRQALAGKLWIVSETGVRVRE